MTVASSLVLLHQNNFQKGYKCQSHPAAEVQWLPKTA